MRHWPIRELLLLAIPAVLGLALMGQAAWESSATYDEVTYLKVAAHWWRTGEQSEISRMGSPVTFWKIQQAPALLLLDSLGHADWIDNPIPNQAALLRVLRLSQLWIWLMAFVLTVGWSRERQGQPAAQFAAWLFALSPNLLAHGGLLTMEMPLVAASTWAFWSFDRFLSRNEPKWFWFSAVLVGLAFSCKFTAVLYPPILALASILVGECSGGWRGRIAVSRLLRLSLRMVGFVALMGFTNLALTGFARIPLSEGVGEHPFLTNRFGPIVATLAEWSWPEDWVGLLLQLKHQGSGGPSYLFGEVRSTGWWYYYPVALAVKAPLGLGLLVLARLSIKKRDDFLILVIALFLGLAMVFSKRNYGVRYLLPIAPMAIVWLSAIAASDRVRKGIALAGILSYALAVAFIHPHELSYFNQLAGGMQGGRRILSDSNLDWSQGLRGLAQLQVEEPGFRDLTFYYFGDTLPAYYQVAGTCHVVTANDHRNSLPDRLTASTSYLAVSISLVWGPWGPPDYFRPLRARTPVRTTRDGTILIFETNSH